MKFLVDNQLPVARARFIESRGCPAKHAFDIGLAEASDSQVFQYAESECYIRASKDEDFLHLMLRPAATTGLVWVRIGNCRKQHLLEAFDRAWLRLVERMESGERIVEVR